MEIEPEGITLTGTSTSRFPKRMMEPLPCAFSISDIAISRFLVFSSFIVTPQRESSFRSRRGGRPDSTRVPLPQPGCLPKGIISEGEEKANIVYICPKCPYFRYTDFQTRRLA